MYPDVGSFNNSSGMYTASHVADKRTRNDRNILDLGGFWTAGPYRSRLELQQISPFRRVVRQGG